VNFDADKHLRISLELARVIRETLEPHVGVYEDREHPRGSTGDTTYEVDVPVENAVQEFFRDSGLQVKVYTEDRGEVLFGSEPEAVYMIDPLDGSRNARRGLPLYSCSIAVFPPSAGYIDEAVVGVVSRLDAREEYTVIAGMGAEKDGEPIKPSGKKDFRDAVMTVGSHLSAGYGVHADFMQRLAEDVGYSVSDVWVKVLGSTALELAYLASGCVDMHLDLRAGAGLEATPKTYDVAAGLLLCSESGAEVLYGSDSLPQRLLIDPTLRVQFLGAGNKTLLNKVLKYL
jgi:myo-inositol-1(or 4)-monophosphatase